mmetsp:Transcript_7705/g.28212  ORF Transcript_7705/g.28212 Transcript_7705/m.28212 type:complete len:437 (-) Transcript_7705:1169-2479(-)
MQRLPSAVTQAVTVVPTSRAKGRCWPQFLGTCRVWRIVRSIVFESLQLHVDGVVRPPHPQHCVPGLPDVALRVKLDRQKVAPAILAPPEEAYHSSQPNDQRPSVLGSSMNRWLNVDLYPLGLRQPWRIVGHHAILGRGCVAEGQVVVLGAPHGLEAGRSVAVHEPETLVLGGPEHVVRVHVIVSQALPRAVVAQLPLVQLPFRYELHIVGGRDQGPFGTGLVAQSALGTSVAVDRANEVQLGVSGEGMLQHLVPIALLDGHSVHGGELPELRGQRGERLGLRAGLDAGDDGAAVFPNEIRHEIQLHIRRRGVHLEVKRPTVQLALDRQPAQHRRGRALAQHDAECHVHGVLVHNQLVLAPGLVTTGGRIAHGRQVYRLGHREVAGQCVEHLDLLTDPLFAADSMQLDQIHLGLVVRRPEAHVSIFRLLKLAILDHR